MKKLIISLTFISFCSCKYDQKIMTPMHKLQGKGYKVNAILFEDVRGNKSVQLVGDSVFSVIIPAVEAKNLKQGDIL